MPTQGGSIPVLSVEKLWLDKKGRGVHVHGDNYVSNADTFPGVSSTCAESSKKFLPAASTTAWLRIHMMSGTAGATFTGYIPIFSGNVVSSQASRTD